MCRLCLQVLFLMSDIIFKNISSFNFGMPASGIVHIWRLDKCIHNAKSLLSQEELLRWNHYVSKEAAISFLKARAGIRQVASYYVDLRPENLVISQGVHGKPFFSNVANFHFSLSHSGNLVIAAVSASPIGIDIERRGRDRNFLGIARRFFDPHEAALITKGNHKAEDIFLNLWTAKESILKLSGEGLGGGLHRAKIRNNRQGALGGQTIFLEQFSYGDYIGTVAAFSSFEVKGWFDL